MSRERFMTESEQRRYRYERQHHSGESSHHRRSGEHAPRKRKIQFSLLSIGKGLDIPFCMLIVLLLAIGITMMFSASYPIAFYEIGLHRITATVCFGNKASAKILENLGFSVDGILRDYLILNGRFTDHALYSCLSTDYRPISSLHNQ